jgi:hypothetical protein
MMFFQTSDNLGAPVVTELATGHTQVFAVTVAILGIVAVILLYRLTRGAADESYSGFSRDQGEFEGQFLVCRKCGSEPLEVTDPEWNYCSSCGFTGYLQCGVEEVDHAPCGVCGDATDEEELQSNGGVCDGCNEDHDNERMRS